MESSTVDMSMENNGSLPLKSHSRSSRQSASNESGKPSRRGNVDKRSVSNLSDFDRPSLNGYLVNLPQSQMSLDALKPMSDSFVGRKQKNRQRVLDAIEKSNCTQAQLQEQLGLGAATVSRWLNDLLDSKRVHICKYEQHPHGGPQTAIYGFGSGYGRRAKRPSKKTDMQRVSAYRKRMRKSGEWEHTLAKRRATYRADNPRHDPLSAAFFGLTSG